MANKYMRALPYITGGNFTNPNENALVLKFMYEFWGYCVNGTSALTTPGGFPLVSYTGGGLPGNFTEGNPSNTLASNYTLPTANIAVNSASGFPVTGTLLINGTQFVTYTGISGNTFTGCVGGSGSVTTGESVVGLIYLGSGTDGATIAGSSVFSAISAPFNQNMVGKYLVMWKQNSGLSDDAIYQITAVPSSSTIVVNPNNGGSPSGTTLHPTFNTRSGINYRIVDVVAASQINTLAPGGYIVFQLNSSAINPGQANSQFQVILRQQTPPFSGTQMQNFGLVGSPSGSWNGSAFTGTPSTTVNGTQSLPTVTLNVVSTQGFPGSGTLLVGSQNVAYTGITPTSFTGCSGGTGSQTSGTSVTEMSYNDTMAEANATTSGSGFWNGTGNNVSGFLTMIADSDFLMLHDKSGNNGGFASPNTGSIMHIETPYRLYPRNNDPNPLAIMIDGLNGFNTAGNNSGIFFNYGGGFTMVGTDSVTRNHTTLVKCLAGDGPFNGGVVGGTLPGQNLNIPVVGFNPYNGTATSSECVLSTYSTPGQYCLARCKLKNVRISGIYMPSYHRIGNAGQFIHLTSGVCWPWDNTILPFNLMLGGF
jgi:hypothetical protein